MMYVNYFEYRVSSPAKDVLDKIENSILSFRNYFRSGDKAVFFTYAKGYDEESAYEALCDYLDLLEIPYDVSFERRLTYYEVDALY